jgi:ferritin-like metal-binding protein YciE
MAKAATSEDLKEAFLAHLEETEGHVKKLEQVFQSFDEKAKGKTCEATVGLLKEGDEIAADFKGSPAINAALISAAQKVEHYEIASYGCLHEWAGLLGNQEAAGLLLEILGEEKAANESLTGLARARSNLQIMYRTALAVSHTLDIDQLLSRIMQLIFEWVEADPARARTVREIAAACGVPFARFPSSSSMLRSFVYQEPAPHPSELGSAQL